MLLHLALLALAVFCAYEMLRPLLPYNLADWAVAALLLGVAYALDRWVPEHYVGLLAVVAAVGVLHQKFGATATGGWALGIPQRSASKIPLP